MLSLQPSWISLIIATMNLNLCINASTKVPVKSDIYFERRNNLKSLKEAQW